jgi:peptidoglycan/LPS O-acetylase OafA/YrhL
MDIMGGQASSGSARRVPELDGVRGLAILLVIVWHYVAAPLQSEPGAVAETLARGLRLTWSGVNLFFVLSGFLIGGILLDRRESPRYFQAFYARRAFRILPLYFAWLATFFALTAGTLAWTRTAAFGHLFQQPFPAWAYGSFTQNLVAARQETLGAAWLGITWSLAVEEQFYLLLPLMVRFLAPARLTAMMVVLVVGAPFCRLLSGAHSSLGAMVLMPCQGDSLLLGVLCAIALRSRRGRALVTTARPWLYVLMGALVAGLGVYCATNPRLRNGAYLYTALAVLFATTLLLAATEQRGPVSSFFRIRWLRYLGTIAYGAYLVHPAVNGLLHGWLLGKPPAFGSTAEAAVTVGALAVTILLASLAWEKFEKPLVAIGHTFAYDSQGRRAPRGSAPPAPAHRAAAAATSRATSPDARDSRRAPAAAPR